MSKMSESGFTGWKDEQDFKKEGINSENPDSDNELESSNQKPV